MLKPAPPDEDVTALAEAAQSLLMPSESDAPFEPVAWFAPPPFSAAALRAALSMPPDTPITTRTLTSFFEPLTSERAWFGDKERERAARFARLEETIATHLSDVWVYRLGTIEITIVILGATTSGRLIGLRTSAVET